MVTSSQESPEPEGAKSEAPPSSFQRLFGRVPAALGFIALAVGVFSAVVAAVFTTFPELRPDPRERAEAEIANLAVDESVTQREFFERLGQVPDECTEQQLQRSGTVFYLRVDAAGFKRSEIGIRWFTYDNGNNQRVPGLSSSESQTTIFEPSAPINRQIAQVWVPWPEPGGEFSVRFELYSRGVLRALVDSLPFGVPPPLPRVPRGPWCNPA